MTWAVGLSSAAIRSLDQLPPRVVPAVLEFLFGALADNPERVGKPMRDDLEGTHSARRGPYRVLYHIHPADRSVTVIRIAHRSDRFPARRLPDLVALRVVTRVGLRAPSPSPS